MDLGLCHLTVEIPGHQPLADMPGHCRPRQSADRDAASTIPPYIERISGFRRAVVTAIDEEKAPEIARLYLDFDSFFASAEQHFNPSLRGKPVGVVPLDSPHTSCIAVSREAKARGVKSGFSVRAARQVLPDMVFVLARHDVYVRLHRRILAVVDTILPVAEVRSIDEMVCALLPEEARQGEALALRIKAALAEAFSPGLTCSIGMAPTELLAKIGAEMHKPDGIAVIRSTELPERLAGLDLAALPGISKGMQARLAAAGVTDFTALWRLAPKQARAIWGNVEGERFWNGLHGLHSERPEAAKSMFGHSRNLPRDWRTPERVAACVAGCPDFGDHLRRLADGRCARPRGYRRWRHPSPDASCAIHACASRQACARAILHRHGSGAPFGAALGPVALAPHCRSTGSAATGAPIRDLDGDPRPAPTQRRKAWHGPAGSGHLDQACGGAACMPELQAEPGLRCQAGPDGSRRGNSLRPFPDPPHSERVSRGPRLPRPCALHSISGPTQIASEPRGFSEALQPDQFAVRQFGEAGFGMPPIQPVGYPNGVPLADMCNEPPPG